MNRQQTHYRVNLFRPMKGGMRDEVLTILAILIGWGACTFGFQALVALSRRTGSLRFLTELEFFNLPISFWFTAQFLPLWFILLAVAFNLYLDRAGDGRRRRRDRSYE